MPQSMAGRWIVAAKRKVLGDALRIAVPLRRVCKQVIARA
jgi:hypothetical protein